MIIGVDIGGTSTKLGSVDQGMVVSHAHIATEGATPGSFADRLVSSINEILDQLPQPAIAVGIGAPNGNQHHGTIDRAPNLPWKGTIPFAQMIQDRLQLPCTLGNDANAAALGEWKYGAGRGTKDLLVVTLGTGLGSGFIIDGKLMLGPLGNAGELGHTKVVVDGRLCTCGAKGCLEAYVSIRGIRQTYGEIADDISILDEQGVYPIARAAQNGEDAAKQTFNSTARWLAVGLANATAITTPDRIVLCGGIARSGDLLMEPLKRYFEPLLLNVHKDRGEIVGSELLDDDAGILGAAALVDVD